MEDCVFCKILDKKISSYKIYEDESVYAFLDIANDAIGHTLVIPKKHYINILDAPLKEYAKVLEVVKLISSHYVDNCKFTGINVLNANGVDAQQSVLHLHFHIIPRKNNDGLDFWPENSDKKHDLKKIQDKLKIN